MMSEDEHKRLGDAAEAFQDFKRHIVAKDLP